MWWCVHGMVFTGVTHAVCGNGWCEIGERCDPLDFAQTWCCAEDCPFPRGGTQRWIDVQLLLQAAPTVHLGGAWL